MTGSLKMARLDCYTAKSQFKSYLVLAAIAIYFAATGSSIVTLCITCSWFMALIASNLFVIQEKNGLDRLYFSLSIRSNDIVLGRYAFIFLSHILSVVLLIVVYSMYALISSAGLTLQDVLSGFCISFLAFSIIAGIQIPIYFKMGYAKGKFWSMIPFIAVMGLMVIPTFVEALSGIVDVLISNRGILAVGSLLASCVVLLISYHAAVILYRKKRV